MKKKTKEAVIIIPLAALVLLVVFTTVPPIKEEPQTFTGLFVEYKGEMIGGDVQGNLITLQNGTTMSLDDFKKITGYNG